MTYDFAGSMRRAAAAVRAADPREATRIIQSALGGQTVDIGARRDPVDITPRPRQAPRLDVEKAASGRPEAKLSGDPGAPQDRAQSPSGMRPRGGKSLGDMLAVLHNINCRDCTPAMRLPGAAPRSAPPVPPGAQFAARAFSCPAGARDYRLYIPASAADAPRGLIVMLHGCTQDPEDFATGTGMNAVAETHGLLVAYPAQTQAHNQMSCWNWFNPADQKRGQGEPAIVAGITLEIAEEFALTRDRIFIAGMSAGGAMAAVLAETYPDLYAAVGIHSGLATGTAHNVVSALAAMRGEAGLAPKGGDRAARPRRVRTIIFHGSEDRTVHPSNALRLVASSSDGAPPDRTRGASRGGRSFTRSVYAGPEGSTTEYWSIDGAGHAWSGGHKSGSYTDHAGPDASAEMVRFFLER
jgi:poly(hydroxyalkanoate) depolymerase family esterase